MSVGVWIVPGHVRLLPTPRAHQALLSVEFSRHESWSRVPFPTSGDLLDPAMETASLVSPALWQAGSLPLATWASCWGQGGAKLPMMRTTRLDKGLSGFS